MENPWTQTHFQNLKLRLKQNSPNYEQSHFWICFFILFLMLAFMLCQGVTGHPNMAPVPPRLSSYQSAGWDHLGPSQRVTIIEIPVAPRYHFCVPHLMMVYLISHSMCSLMTS